jgi:hypothetical protein
MKHRFSYPIVHEVDRKRSDAPPAHGDQLAPRRKSQRELVLESLFRRPDGGSAATRR